MTDTEIKAADLVRRIEEYYSENMLFGQLRLNDYSLILDAKFYIERNICTMKNAKPFSHTFNACYYRLSQLKNHIEKQKNNA